jgi:hypothetical protein
MGDGEEGLGAEEEGWRSGEQEGRKNSIFVAMYCICDDPPGTRPTVRCLPLPAVFAVRLFLAHERCLPGI